MQTENIYTKKGQNQAFMTELAKFMEYTPEQQDAAIQDLFEFLDAVEETNRVTKKAEKLFDDPNIHFTDEQKQTITATKKLTKLMLDMKKAKTTEDFFKRWDKLTTFIEKSSKTLK